MSSKKNVIFFNQKTGKVQHTFETICEKLFLIYVHFDTDLPTPKVFSQYELISFRELENESCSKDLHLKISHHQNFNAAS